jgi:hypothetical protein
MKSSFALLVGFVLFGLSVTLAGPNGETKYFICHFNSEITSLEINELKDQGFQIYEKKDETNVVIVKPRWNQAIFSTTLKDKMKELIMVDQDGNKVYILKNIPNDSPDFLKLFFNFI